MIYASLLALYWQSKRNQHSLRSNPKSERYATTFCAEQFHEPSGYKLQPLGVNKSSPTPRTKRSSESLTSTSPYRFSEFQRCGRVPNKLIGFKDIF